MRGLNLKLFCLGHERLKFKTALSLGQLSLKIFFACFPSKIRKNLEESHEASYDVVHMKKNISIYIE